jgi:hypothetical protein
MYRCFLISPTSEQPQCPHEIGPKTQNHASLAMFLFDSAIEDGLYPVPEFRRHDRLVTHAIGRGSLGTRTLNQLP